MIPRNIQEALNEPKWKLTVLEDMNALIKNDTWEVVELPREKNCGMQMVVHNKEYSGWEC